MAVDLAGQPVFAGTVYGPTWDTVLVLGEVGDERRRQASKWGQQDHPNGTGSPAYKQMAAWARTDCQQSAADGSITWAHILTEEFFEALAESDPAELRAELVQVAAVAAAWVEAIDRQQKTLAGISGISEEIGEDA